MVFTAEVIMGMCADDWIFAPNRMKLIPVPIVPFTVNKYGQGVTMTVWLVLLL